MRPIGPTPARTYGIHSARLDGYSARRTPHSALQAGAIIHHARNPHARWPVNKGVSAQTSAGTMTYKGLREWTRVALLARPWVWVAALTLVGLLLRRYHLGNESFWFDEADIVERARQPLPILLQGFTQAGENGPLYTLLLHYWLTAIDAFPLLTRVLHLFFGP